MSDQDKLYQLCKKFIKKNKITCGETIYQSDEVQENLPELMEEICKLMGYYKVDKS